MGEYIYRITAKRVRLSDGTEANVAKYAYKPYDIFNHNGANTKMHFESGCIASERMARNGRLTGRFVYDETSGSVVYSLRPERGVFSDYMEHKSLPNVTVA